MFLKHASSFCSFHIVQNMKNGFDVYGCIRYQMVKNHALPAFRWFAVIFVFHQKPDNGYRMKIFFLRMNIYTALGATVAGSPVRLKGNSTENWFTEFIERKQISELLDNTIPITWAARSAGGEEFRY
jgi:hypothetical protein